LPARCENLLGERRAIYSEQEMSRTMDGSKGRNHKKPPTKTLQQTAQMLQYRISTLNFFSAIILLLYRIFVTADQLRIY
jgi:hypothetical protein